MSQDERIRRWEAEHERGAFYTTCPLCDRMYVVPKYGSVQCFCWMFPPGHAEVPFKVHPPKSDKSG